MASPTPSGKTWGPLKREDSVKRESTISACHTLLTAIGKGDTVKFEGLCEVLVDTGLDPAQLKDPEVRERIFWAVRTQDESADLELLRKRNAAAIALIDKWLADESGYDEATWPVIKAALQSQGAMGLDGE